MYEIKLLSPHATLWDQVITSLANKISNVKEACESNMCATNLKLGFRANTFMHKIDEETKQISFSAIYQNYKEGETG